MRLLKFIAFLGAACVLILFGMDQFLVQPALQAKPEPPRSFAEGVAKLPEMKGAVPASAADSEPWRASERYGVREYAQQKALETLRLPVEKLCDKGRRATLIGHISYYFEQRGMQMRGFPRTWGAAGAEYIAKAWATADDAQIKTLLRDRYSRGYFSLEDFQAGLRREVAADLLAGATAGGQACTL